MCNRNGVKWILGTEAEMKDFQVSASIEFVLYTLKKGEKKSSLWQILTHMYNKLPRSEMNQCPLVEVCQNKSLVPLLSCEFAEFAGQEESGILESSSGIKPVKWRDLTVHLQI